MNAMVLPTQNNITDLIKQLQQGVAAGLARPVSMPTRHYFSQDIYVREIFMPAGSRVVGKVHATRHLNIILSGECTIWTVHGRIDGKPGMIFESMPGIQKALIMKTDVMYLTVHYNPDNLQDQDALEGKYIQSDKQLDLFPELRSLPICKEQERLTS